MARSVHIALLAAFAVVCSCRAGTVPTRPFQSAEPLAVWVKRLSSQDAARRAEAQRELAARGRSVVGGQPEAILIWAGGQGSFQFLEPDTGVLRPIDIPYKFPLHPVWSPDRGRIAFEASADGRLVLGVTTREGQHAHFRVGGNARTGRIESIKWSPDGTSIALLSEETHFVGRVLLVDLQGGRVRPLPGGGLQAGFGFSPCGRRIAFTSVEGHRTEQYADMIDSYWHSALKAVDLETGVVETLVRGIPNGAQVSWSPAGTHILYADLKGDVVYELATGRRNRLGSPRGGWSEVQWSPDGREILTTTTRIVDEPPDRYEIYGVVVRITPEGREIGRWETGNEITEVSYHPDGSQIVWVELGEKHVHVAAIDGSKRRVVRVLPEAPTDISWSPAY